MFNNPDEKRTVKLKIGELNPVHVPVYEKPL